MFTRHTLDSPRNFHRVVSTVSTPFWYLTVLGGGSARTVWGSRLRETSVFHHARHQTGVGWGWGLKEAPAWPKPLHGRSPCSHNKDQQSLCPFQSGLRYLFNFLEVAAEKISLVGEKRLFLSVMKFNTVHFLQACQNHRGRLIEVGPSLMGLLHRQILPPA